MSAVVDAKDGKEGLKLFRNEPTDLVITDIIMSEKEGLETILELRQFWPEVKIIAISGVGRIVAKGCLNIAQKLGAQRIFCKPLENNELLGAIAELLE